MIILKGLHENESYAGMAMTEIIPNNLIKE